MPLEIGVLKEYKTVNLGLISVFAEYKTVKK